MSDHLKIIYFGSFLDYSALVLQSLIANTDTEILAVVTTPPQPVGRAQILQPTPVALLATQHDLPVFTPEKLTTENLNELLRLAGQAPDFLVVAGYGKILPDAWLTMAKLAPINIHFSLLPKLRGANPGEWAILLNETTTGISTIIMDDDIDTGKILTQHEIAVDPRETRLTLYRRLYQLAADTCNADLVAIKQQFDQNQLLPLANDHHDYPYAQKLSKADGYLDWSDLKSALAGQIITNGKNFSPVMQQILVLTNEPITAITIDKIVRATAGFPGAWTIVPTSKGDKRLKILTTSLENNNDQPKLKIETAQLEGQQPATWNQLKSAIIWN